MSSDLIKNSFITRLLQQIKHNDDTDAQKGLEILKEFVTRNYEYYKYSPIFYGVKDTNGRIIHEGLFDRDEFGNVSVNPKAKELIDKKGYYYQLVNAQYMTYQKKSEDDN